MLSDLHIHTTYSDGKFTPMQVLDYISSHGIKKFAITDHDSVSGYKELLRYIGNDPRLISGIELTTDTKGVHILGYKLDVEAPILKTFLEKQKYNGVCDFVRIFMKVKEASLDITENDFGKKYGIIDEDMIADIIVRKGYARDTYEAYNKYLIEGAPCYLKRKRPTVDECVKLIIDCGGHPVLAHPFTALHLCCDINDYLLQMKRKGIVGVEIINFRHYKKAHVEAIKAAKDADLYLTWGSDFHSPDKYRNFMLLQCHYQAKYQIYENGLI